MICSGLLRDLSQLCSPRAFEHVLGRRGRTLPDVHIDVRAHRPRGLTPRRDAGLYAYERVLERAGLGPVAGVDEAGRGACAGPLVVGGGRPGAGAPCRLEGLADIQTAHRGSTGTAVRRDHGYGHGVVCADRVEGRDRPDRPAPMQHRGDAEGPGRSEHGARLRTHRRVPGARPGRAGPAGTQGRPGGRMRRRRLDRREGDPRPDHEGAARAVSRLRVRACTRAMSQRHTLRRSKNTAHAPNTGFRSSTWRERRMERPMRLRGSRNHGRRGCSCHWGNRLGRVRVRRHRRPGGRRLSR